MSEARPGVPAFGGKNVTVWNGWEVHMGSHHTLNCLIEGESNVFVVRVWPEDVVSDLRKSIQSKRALDSLQGVGPHTLELWKVSAIDEPLCEMTLHFSG